MKKKILTTLLFVLLFIISSLIFVACQNNEPPVNDYEKEPKAEFEIVGTPLFVVTDYLYGGYEIKFSPEIRCLTPNFHYKTVKVTVNFYDASSNMIHETYLLPFYQSSTGTFGEMTIEFILSTKPTFYKIKNIEGNN